MEAGDDLAADHDVPATVAAGSVGAAELSMDELATADAATLRRGLAPLADGYARWLDQRAADVPSLPPPLRLTGERAVETAREAAARIRAGIALLTDPQVSGHADALAAFGFANRAMALQRRHTAVARLREEKGLSYAEALAKVEAPENAASGARSSSPSSCCNLPSLTDPAHPERAAAPTARRPAVLPDRWRQDRGLPRARRVHVRDPPAPGRRRHGGGRP